MNMTLSILAWIVLVLFVCFFNRGAHLISEGEDEPSEQK